MFELERPRPMVSKRSCSGQCAGWSGAALELGESETGEVLDRATGRSHPPRHPIHYGNPDSICDSCGPLQLAYIALGGFHSQALTFLNIRFCVKDEADSEYHLVPTTVILIWCNVYP
jgi:hypothetical protein